MSSMATVNLGSLSSVKSGLQDVCRIYKGYRLLWSKVTDTNTYYDWIENSTNAYINTGLKLGKYRYELKVKQHTALYNNWNPVCGVSSTNTSERLGFWIILNGKDSSGYPQCRYYSPDNNNASEDFKPSFGVQLGDVLTFTMDLCNNYMQIDIDRNGTVTSYNKTGTHVFPSGDTNLDIHLFTWLANGKINSESKPCRIYYFKVYNGDGVLIHNFVPCVNNVGVSGMYDTVTKLFVSNAGSSGTLTCGNDFEKYDYLLSTSPAYIDTNIIPKWEWRYECKIKITDSSHLSDYNSIAESLQGDGMVFGFYKTNAKSMLLRFENNTVRPRRGQLNTAADTVTLGDTIVYLADPQNNYLKVTKTNSSGVTDSYDTTTTEPVISSGNINNQQIRLFARNVEGSLNNLPSMSCKIYYFKIYDEATNQLVHNFVPSVNLVNNTHGMLDTVTGQFYTNANSSGTLTCGND